MHPDPLVLNLVILNQEEWTSAVALIQERLDSLREGTPGPV